MSEEGTNVGNYSLIDAFTGKVVRTFNTTKATGKMGGMKSTYRLNFSDFTEPGTYYLKAGKAVSPRFHQCTSLQRVRRLPAALHAAATSAIIRS